MSRAEATAVESGHQAVGENPLSNMICWRMAFAHNVSVLHSRVGLSYNESNAFGHLPA